MQTIHGEKKKTLGDSAGCYIRYTNNIYVVWYT